MSDATVLANAKRQAELEALGRDLTKPVPPIGTTPESIREKFPNLTDEILQERATFNLKDHMAKISTGAIGQHPSVDLTRMSPEELAGLEKAARQQRKQKEKP